jgi:hypothetical protein
LQTIVAENRLGKLTIQDRDAIARLEHQELFDAYDAAKFNAGTSEKAFQMFNSILIAHLSEAKLEQKAAPYQP